MLIGKPRIGEGEIDSTSDYQPAVADERECVSRTGAMDYSECVHPFSLPPVPLPSVLIIIQRCPPLPLSRLLYLVEQGRSSTTVIAILLLVQSSPLDSRLTSPSPPSSPRPTPLLVSHNSPCYPPARASQCTAPPPATRPSSFRPSTTFDNSSQTPTPRAGNPSHPPSLLVLQTRASHSLIVSNNRFETDHFALRRKISRRLFRFTRLPSLPPSPLPLRPRTRSLPSPPRRCRGPPQIRQRARGVRHRPCRRRGVDRREQSG